MKLYYLDSARLTECELKNALEHAEDYRKARFFSLKTDIGKRECLASDILIKHAVNDFSGISEDTVKSGYNESGALILSGLNLHICLSHTKGHCFLAVSHSPIGIDAEYIRPIDHRKLSERFLSDCAKAYINKSTSAEIANERFFEKWTEVEAYFKYAGGDHLDTRICAPTDKKLTFKLHGCIITIISDKISNFDPEIDTVYFKKE